jgi:CxxC-x17-CxxC domain-containing protein
MAKSTKDLSKLHFFRLDRRFFMSNDKQLTCVDCGKSFVFSASEQDFYAEKGFQNEPKRCTVCRSSRKNSMSNNTQRKEMYKATCSSCGASTEVPFKPTGVKPVYCKACFVKQKAY